MDPESGNRDLDPIGQAQNYKREMESRSQAMAVEKLSD
jgi:hypothetical protein